MHILRPLFEMDRKEAVAFAAARGFGVVIAADTDGPRGSHLPLVVAETGDTLMVQVHVTAANPLVQLAEHGARFLVVVSGPDSYVSNDWYVTSDQVSTWLYEAVHLSGIGNLRERPENRPHGDALLAVSEARLPKEPWSLATMEERKRESMLAAIRVIDIAIDKVEGQSKLNQHKPDVDHVAVADRLAMAEDTAAQRLARRMRELRPDLRYGKLRD